MHDKGPARSHTRYVIAFAAALLITASHPAIVVGTSHAQPEEEFEEEIEDELEEDFEDEFEQEFEEDFDESNTFEDGEDGELEDEEFEEDDFEKEEEPDEDGLEDDDFEDEGPDEDGLEEDDLDDLGEGEGDFEDEEFEGEEEDADDEDDLEEIENERDLEASLSATTELVFIGRDPQAFDVAGGEWLVISDEEDIIEFEARGFEVRSRETVDLLDQVMVRVSPPEGADLLDSRDLLLEVVAESQIDYNHLYQPQARFRRRASGVQPLAAMPLSEAQRRQQLKIGLIDTSVITTSGAIANSNIIARDFVKSSNRRPSEHGTAIATILVGRSANYAGLVPGAKLYAASVFEMLPGRGSTASTASLVRALSWMVENKVPVVNMSLTGPRNAILQHAIDRARKNNVLVVAAIGNDGPAAAPLYPAAYENVVSVTAIDSKSRVFRRANRGRYLDFSAPGVGILHFTPAGLQSSSTGTSIATPFAAVAISLSNGDSDAISPTALRETQVNAIDLGAPGHDDTYGYGLVQPPR